MATKRKKKLAEEPAQGQPLKMEPIEIAKIMRYQAEFEALKARADIYKMQSEALIVKLDPKGEIKASLDEQQRFMAAAALVSARYAEVRESVGKRLGIDMSKYSFDDETGVLWAHNLD